MNIILDNKTYFLDTLIATLLVILLVTSSDFFCFSFLLLFFFRVRKNSPWINKFTIYNNLESRSLWVISPGPKSRLAQFTDFCRSKHTRTSTNWKNIAHCISNVFPAWIFSIRWYIIFIHLFIVQKITSAMCFVLPSKSANRVWCLHWYSQTNFG